MDKIKAIVNKIGELDYNLMEEAQNRLNNLTKPLGSLGRLEELAKLIVGITKQASPKINKKVIFTLAADHGVAEEGVSAYPQEVTYQMVHNFLTGGAGINVLARHINAKVIVVDMGVKGSFGAAQNLINKKIGYGTKNITQGAAMSRADAIKSIEAGIELFEQELINNGLDIVGTGDMGIANTTASAAVATVITGMPAYKIAGRGTGISKEIFKKKVEVIERSIKVNRPDPEDAIDVLSKVGGFEIGGIAGVILAAAAYRLPVVLDGFISCAGALIAAKLQPKAKDFMISAHCSAERGHKIILNWLGLKPLLNLGLRLGEGTGAALGISIVEASCKILNEMATFGSAGVSKKIK